MDRRTFLLVAAAGLAAPAANATRLETPVDFLAASGTAIFPTGPLAANRIAREFAATEALSHPPLVSLTGGDGEHTLSELTGKVRIISIWAERFLPCLHILNEMALLQENFADERFEFMAILTQSPGRLTYEAGRKLMDDIDAAAIPLWVETHGGTQIAQSLCVPLVDSPWIPAERPDKRPPTMPCTLLVDTDGRICGRIIGGTLIMKKEATRMRWQAELDVPPDVKGPATERKPTIWSHPDADAFIAALKGGALSQIGSST